MAFYVWYANVVSRGGQTCVEPQSAGANEINTHCRVPRMRRRAQVRLQSTVSIGQYYSPVLIILC